MCEPEEVDLNQATIDIVLLLINTASFYLLAPTESTQADFIEQLQITVQYLTAEEEEV
jgi:hypothetical protein